MSDHEVDPAVGGLFEQVHALVTLELTGELNEADRVRLDRLICGNPQARRLYAQYIAETAALERYTATGAATLGAAAMGAAAAGSSAFCSAAFGSIPSGSAALPALSSAAGPPVELGAAPSGVLGFLGGLFDAIQASPRLLRATVLVGLGTYFGIVLTTVVWQRTWNADHQEPPAGSTTGRGEIARLISAHNCRWQMAAGAPAEGAALDGTPLRLAAGMAEIQFAGGATVVLTAPAVFTPQTAGRSLLAAGRLVARVPAVAVGFTVTTPMVEVIDLGTEFGLEVDGPGQTDVHVLRGEVEVKHLVNDVVTAEPGVRLTAGQAVRLTEGVRFTKIPVDRDRFSQALRAGAGMSIARTNAIPAFPLVAKNSAADVGDLSFVESFSERAAGRRLMLGQGFGLPEVSFDGTFTITSGPQSRIYLVTKRADYSAVDFTFEATVHLPLGSDPWGCAFFGMAAGGANQLDSVGEPASPSALAVIRLDDGTASQRPELQTRDTARLHTTAADTAVSFADADAPGGDVQRLRMKWNASKQQARFEVAVHYRGGPFTADYALAVNGADNGFDAGNSRLILGGGNGVSFDDISVQIDAPDPARPAAGDDNE